MNGFKRANVLLVAVLISVSFTGVCTTDGKAIEKQLSADDVNCLSGWVHELDELESNFKSRIIAGSFRTRDEKYAAIDEFLRSLKELTQTITGSELYQSIEEVQNRIRAKFNFDEMVKKHQFCAGIKEYFLKAYFDIEDELYV